ncbi:MAG: YceI family protein [Gammaproteobacteria bacterium]|nr:YceI family protein [Gammaproteobacteria bacterium]
MIRYCLHGSTIVLNSRCYVVLLLSVALLMASGVSYGKTDLEPALEIYPIDAESSDIRFAIYRTGMLARFGHNHVISVGYFEGTVYLHPNVERSSVELVIPVDRLIVDDPALRREEGDAFSSEPSADDINGTRANMLGKRLLDADQYPIIRVKGRKGSSGQELESVLNLSVEFLGRVIELSVPVALRLKGDQLEASGAFRLTHDQLGMTPFSVMMGALQVADEMDVKYRIRAERIKN